MSWDAIGAVGEIVDVSRGIAKLGKRHRVRNLSDLLDYLTAGGDNLFQVRGGIAHLYIYGRKRPFSLPDTTVAPINAVAEKLPEERRLLNESDFRSRQMALDLGS
jgi:hypothetical protein